MTIVEQPPSTRSRVIHLAIRVVLTVAIAWIVIGLAQRINFSQVWAALTTLTWSEAAVLLALLVVLRTFNAVPIHQFIPGLTLPRAVLNDSSAYLVSTVSPPPSDMVLRYSMFKAWGIDTAAGFAGVALNSILFYVVRFATPIAGIAVLVIVSEVDASVVVTTSLSAVIAIAIVSTLIAVMRAKRVAAAIGRAGGRVGHRFRPDDVDPEEWSDKLVQFRADIGGQLRRTWPAAFLAMAGMVLMDGTVLLVSTRSVGISSDALPTLLIYGAFLVCYPLTALPFAGLGVFDVVLYGLAVQRLGDTSGDTVVAALVLWRLTTVLMPLFIGLVTYGLWRRSQKMPAANEDATGSPAVDVEDPA